MLKFGDLHFLEYWSQEVRKAVVRTIVKRLKEGNRVSTMKIKFPIGRDSLLFQDTEEAFDAFRFNLEDSIVFTSSRSRLARDIADWRLEIGR